MPVPQAGSGLVHTVCLSGHWRLAPPPPAFVWQAIGAPQSLLVLSAKRTFVITYAVFPAIAAPKSPEPPSALLLAKVELAIVPPGAPLKWAIAPPSPDVAEFPKNVSLVKVNVVSSD